jgi:hypothetical protein
MCDRFFCNSQLKRAVVDAGGAITKAFVQEPYAYDMKVHQSPAMADYWSHDVQCNLCVRFPTLFALRSEELRACAYST